MSLKFSNRTKLFSRKVSLYNLCVTVYYNDSREIKDFPLTIAEGFTKSEFTAKLDSIVERQYKVVNVDIVSQTEVTCSIPVSELVEKYRVKKDGEEDAE